MKLADSLVQDAYCREYIGTSLFVICKLIKLTSIAVNGRRAIRNGLSRGEWCTFWRHRFRARDSQFSRGIAILGYIRAVHRVGRVCSAP